MLGAFNPTNMTLTETPIPGVVLLRSKEGFSPTDNPSGELENPWLQDRSDPRTSVAGWESLVGSKLSVIDIPGNHFQAFDAANVSLFPCSSFSPTPSALFAFLLCQDEHG